MTNIIEPCCAERQLPALLREQKGRAVLFQTFGDVTFDNFLRSVSCMAGDNQLTMTLAVRQVTDKMQRTIQRYQDRGWITTVRLLIGDVEGEVIAFEGTYGVVVIQGPVIDTRLTEAVPQLYAGQFTKDPTSASILSLLEARHRRQQQTAVPNDNHEVKTPADNKKKKVTRKKTKKNEVEPMETVAGTPKTEESAEATA